MQFVFFQKKLVIESITANIVSELRETCCVKFTQKIIARTMYAAFNLSTTPKPFKVKTIFKDLSK